MVTNSSRNLPPALTADGFSAQSDGTRISFEAPAQPVGSAMIGVPFTLWPDCGPSAGWTSCASVSSSAARIVPPFRWILPQPAAPGRAQPYAFPVEVPRTARRRKSPAHS